MRPVYDHVDCELHGEEPQRVWHLNGQIELVGVQGKKEWWGAVLFVENFLETVLDRLEFEPPEVAQKPGNAIGAAGAEPEIKPTADKEG